MKVKKMLVFLLVITLSASLYGCGVMDTMKGFIGKDKAEENVEMVENSELELANDEDMRDTVLYYKNENGFLVPVMRRLPWEEGIAKAALRNMVDAPATRQEIGAIGLSPILPAGTEIRGMSIDSETGLCKVDFTEDVLNYGTQEDEYSLVKGVVYTLTEFPTITDVQFMVGGRTLGQLDYGTDISQPLERKDINLIGAESNEERMVVYYKSTTNGEYEYYVPVTLPTTAPTANVYSALEALFEGPPELSGLYTDIPADVALQGVEVKDGIAYIDLSEEAKSGLDNQAVYDSVAKNIALTLEQFNDVVAVEILIDGEAAEEAGMDVESPAVAPVFANQY